jgi:hypothetical protein
MAAVDEPNMKFEFGYLGRAPASRRQLADETRACDGWSEAMGGLPESSHVVWAREHGIRARV